MEFTPHLACQKDPGSLFREFERAIGDRDFPFSDVKEVRRIVNADNDRLMAIAAKKYISSSPVTAENNNLSIKP